MRESPKVLIPFDRREALSLQEAAAVTGRSIETMRKYASLDDLGRKILGQWMISRVALAMALDGDRLALRAYQAGDRSSPIVRPYFERFALNGGRDVR